MFHEIGHIALILALFIAVVQGRLALRGALSGAVVCQKIIPQLKELNGA